MSSEIEKVLTPIGELELAAVLRDGHLGALKSFPSLNRLAMGWAQCSLESGRGVSVWHHNLGNLMAGSSWTGNTFRLTSLPPPDPPTILFKAHPDFIEGARDYWAYLARKQSSALPWFDAGDVTKACAALKRGGYFTAELGAYTRGVESLFREYFKRIAPVL